MPKVVINDVELEVEVKRNNHRADIAYHVVAGCVLLGQIVRNSTCSWDAQTFSDNPTTTNVSRRHIAVDHLIKQSGYEVRM